MTMLLALGAGPAALAGESLLGKIARKLRLDRATALIAKALRGEDCAQVSGTLWVAAADGSQLREIAGGPFNSPVLIDGEIVAIQGATIVRVNPASGAAVGTPCRLGRDRALLIVAGEKAAGIAVVTSSGKILQLDPATCDSSPIGRLPTAPRDANELKAGLRALGARCQESETFSAVLEEEALDSHRRREDVYVRTGSGDARSLSGSSPRKVNSCPAFSADCRQVVFLARD